jgi:hypothetical protein
MKDDEMLDLGDKVRDKITGFTGIATAVTLYLHRCPLVEVTAKELLDGKLITIWFDEFQLEILTKQEYKYDDEEEIEPSLEVVKN